MTMHVFGADPVVTYALVDASDPTKGERRDDDV